MSTITLTLTVTDAERAALLARFISTATAVVESDDDGVPSDPNGSKVDSTGVVWDARYHGVKMTKNQDGTWRRLKNMSDEKKAQADAYETGCRGAPSTVAAAAAGVPVTAAPVAQVADVPAFLQTGTFAPAAPVMAAPAMPAAIPAMPAAPPVPVIVPAPTYPELIANFTATIARVGQAVVDANLAAIYNSAGVTDLEQLVTNDAMRTAVNNSLNALQPA